MDNAIPPLLKERFGKMQTLFMVDFVNRDHGKGSHKMENYLAGLATQFTREGIEVIYLISFSNKKYSVARKQELLQGLRAMPGEELNITWIGLEEVFESRGLSMTQQNIRANQFWSKDICVAIRVLSQNTQAGNDGGASLREKICLVFPNREDFWGLDRIPKARLAPFIFPALSPKPPIPYTLLPINLRFSGGNILVAGDNVLVGQDAILRNLSSQNLGHSAGQINEIQVVKKRFEYAFPSKNVVFLGVCPLMSKDELDGQAKKPEKVLNIPIVPNSSPFGILQPTFHLALCLTPAGPDKDHKHWLIFLGERRVINPDEHVRDEKGADFLRRVRKALEKLKRQLEGMKIGNLPVRIIRVPLPIYYHRLIKNMAIISFNGVLVENYRVRGDQNKRRIFFPVNQNESLPADYWTPLKERDWERLERLEEKAQHIYKTHGFEIVPIRSNWVVKAFRTRSYLGCYVNVVQREGGSEVLAPEEMH